MANNTNPTSNYKQWMRKYRLIVMPQNGGKGKDLSDLRFAFKIFKAMKDTPNYSQIAVANPTATYASSIKSGDSVTLEAGYEGGNFGLIFSGKVVQSYCEMQDGTDRIMTLVCQDGDQFLTDSFVMKTVAKNTSSEGKLNTLTGKNLKGTIGKDVKNLPKNPRGVVYFGQASKYVSQMALSANSQLYVDDGKINIVAANDYASNVAVKLNPDTGLIGQPTQSDDGISAKCLLNPSIKLNTMVHIDSSWIKEKMVTSPSSSDSESSASTSAETESSALAADGLYRIMTLTYEGDTHGDDWYCSFDAVTQASVLTEGKKASQAGTKKSESGDNDRVSVLAQMYNMYTGKGN